MTFSLIFCTLGRSTEVQEFFKALSLQTHDDFEVIVVDQNKDDRVKDIIEQFMKFMKIRYFRASPGLSKARNIGLEHVSGEILCFPDDDCTYPKELLENISEFFSQNRFNILMGKTIEQTSGNFVAGKPILNSEIMKCRHFGGSSTTLFINTKNKNLKEIVFDENFGIGAKFHAEEENDLVMRLLQNDWQGYYDPNINYVYHPKKDHDYTDLQRANERGYALGALIAKHLFSWCGMSYFVKYNFVRTLGGLILSTVSGNFNKAKYYLYRFCSVWFGFIGYLYFKIIK